MHIVKFSEDVDGTALTKGLPDDRRQCPHWGYVVSGTQTYRFADHDEVFEAGDAFYCNRDTPRWQVPEVNT
ncbi:MAG: hypothetical protein ABIR57_13130 [Aeromicrobium sp.]